MPDLRPLAIAERAKPSGAATFRDRGVQEPSAASEGWYVLKGTNPEVRPHELKLLGFVHQNMGSSTISTSARLYLR
jgi:hypothetical protein